MKDMIKKYERITRELEALLEKTPYDYSEAVAARAHLRNAIKEVKEARRHYGWHLCAKQQHG